MRKLLNEILFFIVVMLFCIIVTILVALLLFTVGLPAYLIIVAIFVLLFNLKK
jgi:hypothetical protein